MRPAGADFVWSDTLGFVVTRTGKLVVTRATCDYPYLFRILAEWLKTWWPVEKRFVFTSINLNANYAARAHRDGNNYGPSVTKALGEFQGGWLRYWGQDDGRQPFDALLKCQADLLNTRDGLCLFDGRHQISLCVLFCRNITLACCVWVLRPGVCVVTFRFPLQHKAFFAR